MVWTIILGVLWVATLIILAAVLHAMRGKRLKLRDAENILKEYNISQERILEANNELIKINNDIIKQRDVFIELNGQCNELDNNIKKQISKTNSLLAQTIDEVNTKKKDLRAIYEEENRVRQTIDKLNEELLSRQSDKDTVAKIISDLVSQVEKLKQTKIAAEERLEEKDNGRVMQFTITDITLMDTLEALKLQYPQLASAFSKIIWENIVQTKFQSMTTDLLKNRACGIYRIWTIDNGNIRNYVGQAKDVRDRWSSHVKGMCGMVKNEGKFYSTVKPHQAHFDIIEQCDESELNSKEHYWIEYYSCVSTGYNTKQ